MLHILIVVFFQYGIGIFKEWEGKKPFETFEIKEDRKVYYKLCIFSVSLNKSAWNYIRTPNIEFFEKLNICLGMEKYIVTKDG